MKLVNSIDMSKRTGSRNGESKQTSKPFIKKAFFCETIVTVAEIAETKNLFASAVSKIIAVTLFFLFQLYRFDQKFDVFDQKTDPDTAPRIEMVE